MKSEWRRSYNPMAGHIAYRLRDINEIDHSGNREYYGEYSDDKETVEELVRKLNKEENKMAKILPTERRKLWDQKKDES